MARVVAYLPPTLKKKLLIHCLNHDITVSDQIAQLVVRFLGET